MRLVLASYVVVAAGGAVGAAARYGLNVALQRDHWFPFGTLSANLAGCLVMGVIVQLVAFTTWFNSASFVPDQYRLLFAVGFCGSFTTLSALVFEINVLVQRNDLLTAFSYFSATMIGGFAFFYAGAVLTRWVVHPGGL